MTALAAFDANAALGTMLAWVGAALVSGTVLALATWLAVSMLRRQLRPSICCALWLVVLIKFVLPAGPGWSVSLTGLAVSVGMLQPQTDQPAAVARPSAELIAADMGRTARLDGQAAAQPISAAGTLRFAVNEVVGGLYLIGLLGVAAWRIGSHRRFVTSCRSLNSVNEATRATVSACCLQLGVNRLPVVRVSDEAPAPFVFGTFRPTLVLSTRHLQCPQELEAVVLHEIAHLRRGDLAVRYLQWVTGTLLYFWPVVAWVNRRIDLARELACDEWALRHGKLAPSQYARCLLEAVQPAVRPRVGYHPQSMASSLKHVERRIDVILQHTSGNQRRASAGIVAVLALASWAVLVLTGAVTVKESKESKTAPPAAKTTPAAQELTVRSGVETDAAGTVHVTLTLDAANSAAEGESIIHQPAIAVEGVDLLADAEATYTWLLSHEGGPCKEMATGEWVQLAHVTEQLTDFAKDHPTVDADGDGVVSRAERDAFLAAKALAEPAAVLKQFPHADANANGALEQDETASLIRGPAVPMFIVMGATIALDEDAPSPVEAAEPEGGVWVTADGAQHDLPAKFEFQSVQDWLLDNVAYEPSVRQVAGLVEQFEALNRQELLAIHPEADADGDGTLSADEQKAIEQEQGTFTIELLQVEPDSMFEIHVPHGEVSATGVWKSDVSVIQIEPKSEQPEN